MHHRVIGQLIDCLDQREFVNKTSICSIICVIQSKYNALMSYYEVIIGYYGLFRVIMGYSGLLWVIMGFCPTAFYDYFEKNPDFHGVIFLAVILIFLNSEVCFILIEVQVFF